MKGAWGLRGFAPTHLHRLVRAHPCGSYWSVGTNPIMFFTSHGKSISLLSLVTNTWKGNLLSLNVMLPVPTVCKIGNLCFHLAVILLSHLTLKQILSGGKNNLQGKRPNICTYNWPHKAEYGLTHLYDPFCGCPWFGLAKLRIMHSITLAFKQKT